MSATIAPARTSVGAPRRSRARDLVLIGAVAFVLRLLWVLIWGRIEPPIGSINDTVFYEYAAASLAKGTYTGLLLVPTAAWPPGFPFLASLVYDVFGVHPKLVLGMNAVLSTATVLLLYLAADRILGRREARVAAVVFALLPGPLYFTGLFLSETTFMFVLVGFLALAVHLPDRRWTPVVLGVALGLAALTRGEGFLMAAIPLAMWWGHVPRRAWLRRAALLLVAMALTVAPWTIRNAVVMDAFIPVSNNASWTLWAGHSDKANGGEVQGGGIPNDPRARDPRRAETVGAEQLRREAITWAVHHPAQELGLIPRKLLALNGPSSGSLGWINIGEPSQRQIGKSSLIIFTVLGDAGGYFLLAATLGSLLLLGARRLWRLHPGMQGVLAYLAVCLVNYGFVYYGAFRYRTPMEPLMLLVAVPLLVAAWSQRGALRTALDRGPR